MSPLSSSDERDPDYEVNYRGSGRKRRPTSRTSGRKRAGKRGRPKGSAPRRYASRTASTTQECCPVIITEERESDILERAHDYVTSIKPDPSTVVFHGTSGPLGAPTSHQRRSARGTTHRRKRQSYSNVDQYVVTASHWDKCGLPPGTTVLRPVEKLVQLVAQAIYSSPHGLLRVHHIYMALQKKYPYFTFLQKKALSSWKSSIRHALFQKWFIKFRIASNLNCGKTRCFYWGLNYNSHPKEWTMPGLASQVIDLDDCVDVKPFGDDLGEFLLDESADLEWLLPLEDVDEKPVLRDLQEIVDVPPSCDIAHVFSSEQQGSSPSEMEVDMESLLDAERALDFSYADTVTTDVPVTWPAEWPSEWASASFDLVPSASGATTANQLPYFDFLCMN
ncbi:uncharacterized protein LOC135392679 isoform X2 [Ornithodoros turicata]|uniref:uncharacterized protein LOC135392679 isoform X2 n=1 Tax=Ornithodoros turicata TaxID=34597 RepID=UPI0031390BAD